MNVKTLQFALGIGILIAFNVIPVKAHGAPPTAAASSVDGGWPKTLPSGTQEITVYQPQLDTWDGIELEFHAAVAVGEKGSEARTFGVIWLTARSLVDKDNRLVYLENTQIPKVSFPSAPDGGAAYKAAIAKSLPAKSRAIALDRVEADLSVLMAERKANAVPLKNDPPRILFSRVPAILLYIDGKPVFKPVEKTTLHRLINTRPLVLRDASGTLFIHVFDGWLKASSLDGSWTPMSGPTGELNAVAEKLAPTNIVDLLQGQPTDPADPKTFPTLKTKPVPGLIVSQVPTTLIVTEGEPNWTPITGTNLLYIANTTGNVFKHLSDQKMYVLDSGRWFRTAGQDGDWEYVPGGELPADFAKMPDTSAKENVKASVPGTHQAEEAIVTNSIPQTAKVDRKTAKITPVVYDGLPQLAPITGTPLQYVVNTATPIIVVDAKTWYAVDKGIWFAATSASGPWTVAASVPAVIYTIPPSSPLHYITYVKIYEVTPTVVYVGYTPGYTGTVVSSDYTVVYGTGYAYTPWVGTVYYPPPPTYGYGVAIRYTPYTGWTVGFGFGYSNGPVTVSIGFGCYPAWGPYYYPPYYRPPFPPPYYGARPTPYGAVAWGPGGWAGTTGNIYSQWGPKTAVTRSSGGYNAYTGNQWSNKVGQSYNSATGQLSAGQRSAVKNVYTGEYAAGRRGVTTNTRTGATAAGRETIQGNAKTGDYRYDKAAGAYDPNSGRYAAGQKTTVGNAKTGQSVTGASGTVGNAKTGQSVDYRGVKTDQGTGVGQIGNVTVGKSGSGDVYAGSDGNVYKKDSSGKWSQYDSNSGNWKPNTGGASPMPSNLNAQAQARQTGQQRTQNYQSSYRAPTPSARPTTAPSGRSGGRRR